MSSIRTRSFRPHGEWERQHINLLNSIVHGFSAYGDLPKSFRECLYQLFVDGCSACHCPSDIMHAVFSVLTCCCDYIAVSVDYYISPSCLHKWRRRVIISIARKLLSDLALRYDV